MNQPVWVRTDTFFFSLHYTSSNTSHHKTRQYCSWVKPECIFHLTRTASTINARRQIISTITSNHHNKKKLCNSLPVEIPSQEISISITLDMYAIIALNMTKKDAYPFCQNLAAITEKERAWHLMTTNYSNLSFFLHFVQSLKCRLGVNIRQLHWNRRKNEKQIMLTSYRSSHNIKTKV